MLPGATQAGTPRAFSLWGFLHQSLSPLSPPIRTLVLHQVVRAEKDVAEMEAVKPVAKGRRTATKRSRVTQAGEKAPAGQTNKAAAAGTRMRARRRVAEKEPANAPSKEETLAEMPTEGKPVDVETATTLEENLMEAPLAEDSAQHIGIRLRNAASIKTLVFN